MNSNNSTRQKAIEWWDDLSEVAMIFAVAQYHGITFEDAEKGYHEAQGKYSDAFIETIYLSEHPEQAISNVEYLRGKMDMFFDKTSGQELATMLNASEQAIKEESHVDNSNEGGRSELTNAAVAHSKHSLGVVLLQQENTSLKERIKVLETWNEKLREVATECYGYFSAPNFTDRYGTAERLKEALNQK